MSKGNHYKWLLVVEGKSDRKTYETLLLQGHIDENDFYIFSACGKGHVLNAKTWDTLYFDGETLFGTVKTACGRQGFCGIILIVDADVGCDFSNYNRSSLLLYTNTADPVPVQDGSKQYWHVDRIVGIPVYGVVVPDMGAGCLETDLLKAYGFPLENQPQYFQFMDIIKTAGDKSYWDVPKHGDGKFWWEDNEKAKLDKFMYAALKQGFNVSGEEPSASQMPSVITTIMTIMNTAFP